MSEVCNCQFCQDSARLKIVLPLVPEEHRKWVQDMVEAYWNADEELSYKRAILNGTWPEAVIDLKFALLNAEKIQAQRDKEAQADKDKQAALNQAAEEVLDEELMDEDGYYCGGMNDDGGCGCGF